MIFYFYVQEALEPKKEERGKKERGGFSLSAIVFAEDVTGAALANWFAGKKREGGKGGRRENTQLQHSTCSLRRNGVHKKLCSSRNRKKEEGREKKALECLAIICLVSVVSMKRID